MTLPAGQDKFFGAIEQTADSVFITDKKGNIEYINPAFEQTTGFKKSEVLGKTLKIIKSGLQSPEFYKKLWTTILSGQTYRSKIANRKKDKTIFYADHTITPLKDKNGNITHFVGIWKDITEQTLMEKRKQDFMAEVSHELRSPLTSLKIYNDFIQKSLASQNKKIPSKLPFDQINRSIDKMSELINNLLDNRKIEEGKFAFKKSTFYLEKLVDEIINDFNFRSEIPKIIRLGNSNPQVYADKKRVGQVIGNLLTNAIKYSPKNKNITVKLRTSKSFAVVSVKDFGVGIPKSQQKKIFERFYQVGKQQNGYGLGLAICAEIINFHGGKIWVKSEHNQGSTFSFTLPLKLTPTVSHKVLK